MIDGYENGSMSTSMKTDYDNLMGAIIFIENGIGFGFGNGFAIGQKETPLIGHTYYYYTVTQGAYTLDLRWFVYPTFNSRNMLL